MAKVEKLVPFILKWEGGFVNDPVDRGGATNKGVTIGTFRSYRSKKGLPAPSVQDLKDISDAEWMDILKTLYWDRWLADNIKNQSVANLLVDWVWGSGVHGIKIPQRILGVVQDGIVGPKTLAALNNMDEKEAFDKIWDARKKFFESIVNNSVAKYKAENPDATEATLLKVTQKRFLRGWMNRLNDYRFYPTEHAYLADVAAKDGVLSELASLSNLRHESGIDIESGADTAVVTA